MMLINIDDCKGLDMKLCQLAEEKQLTYGKTADSGI